jgi:CubicO group peptidase (beta-lactamase class C family)
MSVLMLAEDGKLSLNDSVRKFLPELPDYTSSITIYHLLTHTSGVRDYLTLGNLAGQPPDFVHTDRSALRSISRQNALNFAPGTEYLYSNSGYVLLSLIVKRVTEKNLDEFAQSRIFGPLGMKATRFQHDHSALVPDKALGYQRVSDRWHLSNSMLDVVGDGGLYSSVSDMLRWASNFDDPKIGAPLLTTMQTPGRLGSGKEIEYGMGLVPSEYQGLRIVEHSGGLGGYRTEFLRFPAQKLTVICMCNDGTANPSQLARQVAQTYLSSDMKASQTTTRPSSSVVTLTGVEIQGKVGLYRSETEGFIEVVERNGRLNIPAGPGELVALDRQRFTFINAPDVEVRFDAGTPAGSFVATRPASPPLQFQRVVPVNLSETQLRDYVGEFESRELNATYSLTLERGDLAVVVGDRAPVTLRPAGVDFMRVQQMEFSFRRDAAGRVAGFLLSSGRVRGIQFQRR